MCWHPGAVALMAYDTGIASCAQHLERATVQHSILQRCKAGAASKGTQTIAPNQGRRRLCTDHAHVLLHKTLDNLLIILDRHHTSCGLLWNHPPCYDPREAQRALQL
jgi:hypothetical protein